MFAAIITTSVSNERISSACRISIPPVMRRRRQNSSPPARSCLPQDEAQIVAKAWPEVAEPLARQPKEREDEAVVVARSSDSMLPFIGRVWRDEVEEGALPAPVGI